MIKNFVIIFLLVLVALLSRAAVRLENYHYASFVGMCAEFKSDDPLQAVKRHECLHKKETRTSSLAHLFYALVGE
jgi:hypothetical protein